jgi:hypothetical protein
VEYYQKQSQYAGQAGVYVWDANTYDSPAALKCTYENVNGRVYKEILKRKVLNFEGFKNGKLKYQYEN